MLNFHWKARFCVQNSQKELFPTAVAFGLDLAQKTLKEKKSKVIKSSYKHLCIKQPTALFCMC